VGIESTVLDMCHGQPRILRPGGTPQSAIESLIGAVAVAAANGAAPANGLASPGMLKSHYAPHIPLTALDLESLCKMPVDENNVFLFFDGASRDAWLSAPPQKPRSAATAVLSVAGNLTEAAAGLFETLHELDNSGAKQIFAQLRRTLSTVHSLSHWL